LKIWSAIKVVHSELECKFWLLRTPSVDEVRPGFCPACTAAAREPGRRLGIVGHGLRERQLRGPMAVQRPPTVEVLRVRRYRCRHCSALITVVPREVEPRRHYSRPAIAMALALMGLVACSSPEIREAISPWRTTTTSAWRTLPRWIDAVRRGTLFSSASPSEKASCIEVAERVAQVAMSHAPPGMRGAPELELVFAGAVAMA
jgi:Domain of unknown function (DUF6431)